MNDNTDASSIDQLTADVQEKLNEALKPHVEKAKAVHENVIKPKTEEASAAFQEAMKDPRVKSFRQTAQAYLRNVDKTQAVMAVAAVGLFLATRQNGSQTMKLLKDVHDEASNTVGLLADIRQSTHEVNSTLLDILEFATRKEERLLLDRRGMGAEIDNYAQKGVPFTYYPGLGVRPNDLSNHERFWGTE